MPYKDHEKRREWQRAYQQRWYAENKERKRAYAQKPEVRERQRAYMQKYLAKLEVKERKRTYMQKYLAKPEVKERQRAYMQRPEVKERQRAYMQRWYAENKERRRAYAQKPEVRERKRAYARDIDRLKKRLELDDSGVAAIMAAVAAGHRYKDIAKDWLIDAGDVSDIAIAHGVVRRPRKALPQTDAEVRP